MNGGNGDYHICTSLLLTSKSKTEYLPNKKSQLKSPGDLAIPNWTEVKCLINDNQFLKTVS